MCLFLMLVLSPEQRNSGIEKFSQEAHSCPLIMKSETAGKTRHVTEEVRGAARRRERVVTRGRRHGTQLLDRGADANRRKLIDAGTQPFDPRSSTWPDASTAALMHREFAGDPERHSPRGRAYGRPFN
jgi:hypothetical protein